MKKNNLFLLSTLFLAIPALASVSEDPLKDSLPGLMKRDATLRPYVKDLITGSSLPEQSQLLTTIESPLSFRGLNFRELLGGVFGRSAWVPHVHEFRDVTLHNLLHPYFPRLLTSEMEMVFLANVLYEAGMRIYDQTSNPAYLEYAASIGHPGAQRKMFSVDFKSGKLAEARNYLFCSAAQGNTEALLTLSEAYQGYWGIGILRDLSIARLLCQEASDLGNPEAQFRIEVATLTEGFFDSQRNFQQGVRKAKELADIGNQRAHEFIKGIHMSSGDALQEGNDFITYEDLDFLRSFLGWKDAEDE